MLTRLNEVEGETEPEITDLHWQSLDPDSNSTPLQNRYMIAATTCCDFKARGLEGLRQ